MKKYNPSFPHSGVGTHIDPVDPATGQGAAAVRDPKETGLEGVTDKGRDCFCTDFSK